MQQQRATADEKTAEWKAKVKAAKLEDDVKIAAVIEDRDRLSSALSRSAAEVVSLSERLLMVTSDVEVKTAEYAALEGKVSTWRAKVKRIKDEDEAKLDVARRAEQEAVAALRESVGREEDLKQRLEDCEVSCVQLSNELSGLRETVAADALRMQQWQVKVKEVKSADDQAVASLRAHVLALQDELLCSQLRGEAACKELAERLYLAQERFEEAGAEMDIRLASSRDRAIEFEQKCDVLRQELKRQRDTTHRAAAAAAAVATTQKEVERLNMPTLAVNPPLQSPTSATSTSTAASFEKDMMSLAAQQSTREQELRLMRQQVRELERRNADLASENEHNSKVLVQLTQQLEHLKSNERRSLCVEYIKNIVLQFLCTGNEDARLRMVPAIATALEFNSKEKNDVQKALPRCPRFY